MKKISKHILGLAIISLLTLSSCQDAFDIVDEDSLIQENAFRNVSDLESALFGTLDIFGYEAIIDLSNMTDDTKVGNSSGGQKVDFHSWQLNAGTAEASTLWTSMYAPINRAVRLLEASEDVVPAEGEEALYNQIRGEANAIIAAGHYYLLAAISEQYTNDSPGVPFVDFVAVPGDMPARNTFGEVVAGIKAQLDLAEARIPASQTSNIRFTQDFVTGMRAKVALLEGELQEAIDFSQELIDAYPLANQVQYADMFRDLDETEVIMKLDRVVGDFAIGGTWVFAASGDPFMEMSNTLYNELISQPDDVRLPTVVNVAGTSPNNNIHLIGKYLGDSSNPFLNDIKLMRVSEMYLINAEAKAIDGDLEGAAEIIKDLRDARFGTDTDLPSYTGTQTAIVDILRERRLELAYEGHRYLDVKRLRTITGSGFQRAPLDCGPDSNAVVPCVLQASDFRFTFPIPTSELNANINVPQNTGY